MISFLMGCLALVRKKDLKKQMGTNPWDLVLVNSCCVPCCCWHTPTAPQNKGAGKKGLVPNLWCYGEVAGLLGGGL